MLGETVMTLPTIRFNVDTVVHNNTSFAVWDVGGHDTTHLVWKHNLHNTHGLIFVVDSTDHERITEAHDKLHTMLAEDELRDTVVVVLFGNKQDLPQAMSVAEMTHKLGLDVVIAPLFVLCETVTLVFTSIEPKRPPAAQ